jgi:hypothetical protein
MAQTDCPPGVWTTIPDTGGNMLLTAPATGFYVDTAGDDDLGGAQPLGPMESMVITAGLPVRVQPLAPITVKAISLPV